jgi:predicted nucleotidyltransferase
MYLSKQGTKQMTKKDYILIAAAIAESDTKDEIIANLLYMLKNENSAFDREKFRRACRL